MAVREMPQKKYLSLDEASAITSLSQWTLRRLCYSGALTSTKVKARLLIPVQALEDFMAANTRHVGARATSATAQQAT